MGPRSFFLLSLLLVTGFFSFGQSGTIITDSIISGSQYRKYILYVPASYSNTKASPLVINLHGLASNATQQMLYSNFLPIADTANFLVVHPEGINSGGSQFWNAGLFQLPDDVKFMSDLIDSLGLTYTINKNAVYSCGLSNGAILSYYLACMVPNKIAAIASVAGTMFRGWYYSCNPATAVPVMEIHGTDDGTVPYEGNGTGGLYLHIDSIVTKWSAHNRCNPTSIVKALPDINTTDNSTVLHYKWLGGADNSSVELFKVIGGSHSWPGALNIIFKTNEDFNASAEIWRFFRQYRLDQFVTKVGLREEDNNLVEINLFPSPSNEVLNVTGISGNDYRICDIFGKELLSGNYSGPIAVSGLAAGVYLLQVKKDDKPLRYKFIKD